MVRSLPIQLKIQLDNTRLIFTITTGRSGTGYLAKVLSFMPTIASSHEADPRFSNVMRSIQNNKNAAYKFWIEDKLPQIVSEPRPIYAETSHLFCKGFIESLLNLGLAPDLILLTRPHRDVATSMYQLETIPGRTEKALEYYLSPSDPDVLALLPKWQKLNDYQLCYWYCLEIGRRSLVYEKEFLERNSRVVKTSLNELNTYSGVYCLLKELDLPRFNPLFWKCYYMNKNKKVNIKTEKKIPRPLPNNIDALEKEVEQLVKYTLLSQAE